MHNIAVQKEINVKQKYVLKTLKNVNKYLSHIIYALRCNVNEFYKEVKEYEERKRNPPSAVRATVRGI